MYRTAADQTHLFVTRQNNFYPKHFTLVTRPPLPQSTSPFLSANQLDCKSDSSNIYLVRRSNLRLSISALNFVETIAIVDADLNNQPMEDHQEMDVPCAATS